MTFLLAAQAAQFNVRANAICPGSIPSDIHASWSEEQFAEIRAGILLAGEGSHGAGTPQDIAEVALFLAAPTSRWITGTVITVNGGQLMR